MFWGWSLVMEDFWEGFEGGFWVLLGFVVVFLFKEDFKVRVDFI